MVKVHRDILAGVGPAATALLDTPFGFQANADDLVEKISEYFRDSVGTVVELASWRRSDEPAAERERALARLSRASWAFAGPGSPSYALRQWEGTPVPAALLELVRRGGALVMGSAAAVTTGVASLPVYEIYKVGDEARWLPGLDLLGALTGLKAAVIPHYDNREGGRHDTRYCYMGETRLLELESMLPDEVGIIGVDEHTAAIIDVDSGRIDIRGTGGLTIRYRDRERAIPAGSTITVEEVDAALRGDASGSAKATRTPEPAPQTSADAAPGLRTAAVARREAFDAALAARDADGALEQVLGLEQDIHDWSRDTLQSDDIDTARATLRAMLVELAGAATSGLRDEREVIGPYIDVILDLRGRARDAKDFATSDVVRDSLAALGIDVRDTPEGAQWSRSAP
jgi:cyanophycinase-like exopeptidase